MNFNSSNYAIRLILCSTSAIFIASCGGGSENFDGGDAFIGYYEVTSHNKNDENCDSVGAQASDPIKAFELSFVSVSNLEAVMLTQCESRGKCDSSPSQQWKLTERDELGWSGDLGVLMTPVNEECSVSVYPHTATLETTTLTLSKKKMQGIYPPPEFKKCSDRGVRDKLLDAYSDEFLCSSIETITAEKK